MLVATVLTACGIETAEVANQNIIKNIVELQQCLPLAVLKLARNILTITRAQGWLQQCLPLAVLKPGFSLASLRFLSSCNSAYRLRY